jgi:hypothetical protein
MFKLAMAIAAVATFAGLAGCATRSETVGTLGGAAVGAAATGGSGLGTAAGGVVGYEAGKEYDKRHR